LGVWKPTFVVFGGLFFEFLTPSILRGHNFFNSISFFTIFSALDAPIGGVQVLFRRKKKWSPPLGFGLPLTFKCYSCNSIAINEQLKRFNPCALFLNPMLHIMQRRIVLLCSHIKIHVPFWDELKKVQPKGKT
jgi:hypothetical protein